VGRAGSDYVAEPGPSPIGTAFGAPSRGRRAATRRELTPQELRIAVKVAEGRTNREVAAELFLSPKTVEYHLGKVYAKLSVRSRTELARLLTEAEGAGPGQLATPT
jgi:DNA-binding NarL/FixJ family response regulator